jgi:type II secretory pathway component PulC
VPFTRSSQDGGSGFAMHVPGKKNRFGFQDGDVVTAINGHTVEDADAASQWMQQVSGSTVAFTVNRGGQSETFDVDIGD